jgi:lysophospholipase L1-like esterase
MRSTFLASLGLISVLISAQPSRAGTMTYLAVGDSVAFGETTFANNPSNGDRGYVADYANYLASKNSSVRPIVVNTAIDGETSSSFFTASGRVLSIPGTTDQTVAAWNTNYTANPSTSQNIMMEHAILSAKTAGNPVGVVSVSLGANDLFTLAASPAFQNASPASQQAQLAQTLTTIAGNYATVLGEIHALAPNAKVFTMGEYNPFPGQPGNPLSAIAGPAIKGLNATIEALSAKFGTQYVDTYTPFVGHESAYTYIAALPGDVHPNALGYSVIASQIEAVPEPSTIAVMGLGFIGLAATVRRRRRQVAG